MNINGTNKGWKIILQFVNDEDLVTKVQILYSCIKNTTVKRLNTGDGMARYSMILIPDPEIIYSAMKVFSVDDIGDTIKCNAE